MPQPSFDTGQIPTPVPQNTSFQQPGALAPSVPMAAHPTMPAPTEPSLAPAQGATATGAGDDENALDQEWIAKARGIVMRTRSDPYMQSKELSKIKAQYIKVRYNKDVKTVDD